MDIQRLGGGIQPDLPEPVAEPAVARDPAKIQATPIPIPGTDLAGATPMPLPGPDVISATPISIPGPNPISSLPVPIPGPDVISATPMPLPGPDVISATPISIPGPNPISSLPVPIPGPDVISATPMPLPGPDVISATPMPLPGTGLAGATPIQLPFPNPEGTGQPGPVPPRGKGPPAQFMDTPLGIAVFKDQLQAQLANPISDPAVPVHGPRPGPDPGPGGAVIFGPGLRAEQDVPPTPNPEPEPDPDPIPEPDRGLLNPQLGVEFVKAQLHHGLESDRAETAGTRPLDGLRPAGDGPGFTGPMGAPGTQSADEEDDKEEEVQL